jgi:hypothetical protein
MIQVLIVGYVFSIPLGERSKGAMVKCDRSHP